MIRKGLVYALPPFALMLALSIWGWLGTAPDAPIPVHFGLDGEKRATRLLHCPKTLRTAAEPESARQRRTSEST